MTSPDPQGPRVAFLKGINVGGHRLTMDELKGALASVGLDGIQTFIASGNVAFDADARSSAELEQTMEAALAQSLGYEVSTFIRTHPELSAVAAFTESEAIGEGWKPHVMFGRAPASNQARDNLAELETPDDLFRFHEREVVWLRRGGMTDSVIKAHHLDRALEKKPVTARTLKTVQRIVAKFGA